MSASLKRNLLLALLPLTFETAGCSDTADEPPSPLQSCEGPTSLMDLHETWEGGHDSCRAWIEPVRGRLVHNSSGSAVVWTRNIPSGLGLLVSAFHVLGPGWFHSSLNLSPGQDVPETVRAPQADELGVMRLRVPPPDGTFGRSEVSGLWVLYNAAIVASEHEDVTTVLPRSDYVVGLTDGRRVEEGLAGVPSHTLNPSVGMPLYDPAELTKTADITQAATPESLVLLAGYPQAGPPLGAISVGRVLGDAEAEQAIDELRMAGDEEGDIPYEPSIEFLVEGRAEPGMSGGGAFDRNGALLGIMVRASTADLGTQYVRVVRITWISERLRATAQALDADARAKVEPYMPVGTF